MHAHTIKLSLLVCLIAAALTCFAHGAVAQSFLDDNAVVDKENAISTANQFFKDCAANPVFNVSEETNLENCACASAQVELWERKQEEKLVARDFLTPAKERDELTEDVLMLDIYAPCLHIPAREILYEECTLDMHNKSSSQGHPDKLDYLCTCISNDLTRYYEYAAEAYLEMRHAEGQIIYDPIEEVQRSTDYMLYLRDTQNRCFEEYYEALRKAK